jgi:thioesterase domain-containing protein
MNPLHLGALLLEIAKICLQIKLPRSYSEFRGLVQWVGVSLPASLAEVRHASWRARFNILRGVLAEARRALRVFRANSLAGLQYAPGPYTGRCVLFRTGDPTHLDPIAAQLVAGAGESLEVVNVDGTHMSLMMEDAHVRDLAVALRARLAIADMRAVQRLESGS